MTTPLVSVLCATRNRPGFLRNAVRLFQASTWPRKELVVLDDSDARHHVDLSREGDVHHVLLEPMTLGEKYNVALEHAQGEVLAYADDDDYYGPGRLAAQLRPIQDGAATVTGIPRDLILRLPGMTWHRFKPHGERPPVGVWNPYTRETGLKVGDFWKFKDSTAMWSRDVHARGARHDHVTVNDKEHFFHYLHAQRERLAIVPNDKHFVQVRHGGAHVWRYREELIEEPAPRPAWFPEAELRALAEAAGK